MKKFILILISLLMNNAISAEKEQITRKELRQLFIVSGLYDGIEKYGGVLLFENDIKNIDGNLCQITKDPLYKNLSFFIDQESNNLKRVKDIDMGDMRLINKNTFNKDNEFQKIWGVAAKELNKRCFYNNLAPVVDVQSERSYSTNKNDKWAELFAKKMNENGVMVTIKHYPFSHKNIECNRIDKIKIGKEEIKIRKNSEVEICHSPYNGMTEKEFKDFQKQKLEVPHDAIMMSFKILKEYSNYPAFLENKYVKWLREDFKNNSLIMSDAIWELTPEPKLIVKVLKNVDWLMVPDSRAVEKALPYIEKAIQKNEITKEEIIDKLIKIKKYKEKEMIYKEMN